MSAVDIDRDPAHDAASHELAKPMYHPDTSLLDRLGDWLNDRINQMLAAASEIPGSWFTLTVLAIVLVVVGIVAIRMVRRTMGGARQRDPMLFDAGIRTAAEHRATAAACAERGEWAEAIRHRLRAIARDVEESGALSDLPGRTATEWARAAATALPDFAADLSRAAEVFNDVTYGERPGTESGYQIVADLDDRLRNRRRAGAAAR
ncbi:hypothetical protein BHQ15_06135 [Mycolicibacillus koreensis]|nr:hypothetical protein BHQ15_06135 [Mycolicibacillus koreensis]